MCVAFCIGHFSAFSVFYNIIFNMISGLMCTMCMMHIIYDEESSDESKLLLLFFFISLATCRRALAGMGL